MICGTHMDKEWRWQKSVRLNHSFSTNIDHTNAICISFESPNPREYAGHNYMNTVEYCWANITRHKIPTCNLHTHTANVLQQALNNSTAARSATVIHHSKWVVKEVDRKRANPLISVRDKVAKDTHLTIPANLTLYHHALATVTHWNPFHHDAVRRLWCRSASGYW